jgi:hypothetical protein
MDQGLLGVKTPVAKGNGVCQGGITARELMDGRGALAPRGLPDLSAEAEVIYLSGGFRNCAREHKQHAIRLFPLADYSTPSSHPTRFPPTIPYLY